MALSLPSSLETLDMASFRIATSILGKAYILVYNIVEIYIIIININLFN